MSTHVDAAAGEEYVDPAPVADATDRGIARRLTIQYVVASTVIFLATGLLGLAMRQSQADVWRFDDNTWYAIMTAHGLGAFVGWAAFAVMGLSFWVLSEVGFPMGRAGTALARLTFWLMVIGVAGVVVTTLGFSFAGSWVFLYPLPFESAGQWGDGATGFFSASVLLVGLSIVTWCLAILVIVLGPGLRSQGGGLLNRVGAAMGFGFIWPKRFRTERPVPYAVIPLTVIAIDMIIATLPLAVLLVAMIIQSFAPSVSVDPLLAKNVLWWFGHPVVYLLLFPAVAIYYLLVPRFAKRRLVAGNIIAVAWAIAIVANVTVWAHHMYMDYPNGIQAAINTTMEPITFALTIVSALSLYSLFFTIFRSRWTWNAASTALFLGLASWLLAGLSGVINATIAWNAFVHNTLWVVGHFHHMALINIGIVIFGAIYAFLPRLIGRPLYSDRLGMWHVWLTFAAGTANSVIWLIQGLDGAPRRFAILPEQYSAYNAAAIPVVIVLALAQLLFVWNMIQTFRGATTAAQARSLLDGLQRPRLTSAPLQALGVVLTILVLTGLGTAGWAVGRGTDDDSRMAFVPQPAAAQGGAGGPGLEVFVASGCGSCHAFQAAGSTGAVGPSLDERAPTADRAEQVVRNGLNAMPAFGNQLSDDEIEAVATYVAENAAP
ncbi:cbb3-type cytochrome c oxidase subunit I [Miltoncostaea marina]|uniref:cbb3-type cytochrome c oxidase subunit I n=1 Tax=Miltoncostaea marina TaxID=2843215 RepID=UPI001C3C2555|nr:cbb3-type cytochrome c oxidase subunit I [Miltoncostaea marina]